MQNFTQNVRVTNKHYLGWNVNAAVNLRPGDVILEEEPLFIAPHWEHERMKCVKCHQDSFVMCKRCQFFPLCLNCKDHNEYDCEFMLKATKAKNTNDHGTSSSTNHVSKDLLVKNYPIYAILKLLLLMENERTRSYCDSIIPPMLDLNRDYRQSETWFEQDTNVVKPLMASGLLRYFQNIARKRGAPIDSEFLHELCYLIDTNAFEVACKQSDDSMKGIYTMGTRIPHNCIANTVISFDENYKMKIYAAVSIHKGDAIYNSYVSPLMGTSQRQVQLRLTRQITCRCARCLDPTEMGTHLSTLKCQKCAVGLVTCKNPAYDDIWECNECAFHVGSAEVDSLLADVVEDMAHCNNDLKSYERLLTKYEPRFHRHHFLMIEIKQNIVSILGLLLANPYSKLERKYLERKIQLIEELLPIIRAIQPGISKLYTVALYDFVVTSRELEAFRYENREIQKHAYIESLQRANRNIQEVVTMLSFEPINSSEGHLAQRILIEKKQIEQNIESVTREMNTDQKM